MRTADPRLRSWWRADGYARWEEGLPAGSVLTGGVVGDDTTLDTPDRRAIAHLPRRWSGIRQRVVGGIHLLSRRWTDGHVHLPGDGRSADHAHDGVPTRLRPGAGDGSGGAGRAAAARRIPKDYPWVKAPMTAAAARGGPAHLPGGQFGERNAGACAARVVADPAARPSRG